MTDTTGDIFQQAGEQAPFSMISESAEMPETGINNSESIDKNQLNLFPGLNWQQRHLVKNHNFKPNDFTLNKQRINK